MAPSRRDRQQIDALVDQFGYAGLVAALSAHALRVAHELEKEADPREYAVVTGRYVWIAELLGRCSDALTQVE